ncbi:16S rRNA processing protein RimM [Desulfacinum hydrothermale DSM 13146]|uniref:Ribosome maturation factor RimM n=1 Tax=Desulfacinum hydrothermale DSM 13146 TaxID=1121390 RepID=A0A1W1XPA5_9BACT|nr:16S rRNA processing protein RimM [Desulfacinum hydrothermale DSM 13146]
MQPSKWVPVGRISRTHGTDGAVLIVAYGETLGERQADERLFVCLPSMRIPKALTIEDIRPHGRQWRVRFREVGHMQAARALVGLEVGVPEEELPELEEGEYYHYQLVGLRVETVSGHFLGILKEILESPAHDIYVVEDERGGELLLPAVEEIVRAVRPEENRVVVQPPAGLTDDL